MRAVNKIFKKITSFIIALSICVSSYIYVIPVFAVDGSDSAVWTGFASCESGGEGFRQAGGDGGNAYGIFQFDLRYTLWPFLETCINEDADKYSGFQTLLSKYNGTGNQIINDKADLTSLIQAWHNAYDSDPEGFAQLQMSAFVSMYYTPLISYCNARGIDIQSEEYSPVIRGTLFSISIWAGQTGAQKVINRLSSSMTEEEMLDACYSLYTAGLKGTDSKYYTSFKKRWTEEQKALAVQDYAKWKSGIDIPTTDSSDILTSLGGAGVIRGIDGGSYIDYVKEWIDGHPDLSAAFKESGGWNTENREWCMLLRDPGDSFFNIYGILGGGEPLDFQTATSGGLVIGSVDVNAENFQIPDNGSSMPIVYLAQSGSVPWASLPFGGGNIASSGCSITSLAMVVSYLKGGTDKDAWIFPSDIRAMIASKTGSYNHFYSGSAGQSWGIFSAVAGYYGLTCNQISSSSIVAALSSGKPVIMSCKPGEFTKKGHFIVLTGLTDDGYVTVNDPNSAHASYSYKKYPVSYIASQGKGWWAFSN